MTSVLPQGVKPLPDGWEPCHGRDLQPGDVIIDGQHRIWKVAGLQHTPPDRHGAQGLHVSCVGPFSGQTTWKIGDHVNMVRMRKGAGMSIPGGDGL